jgi:hypothetical protein
MTATVDDAMKSLYEIAQGTYVTRPYATTSRTFKLNPMLAQQKPEFKPDPLLMVPRDGVEPPTHGFSIRCSTN